MKKMMNKKIDESMEDWKKWVATINNKNAEDKKEEVKTIDRKDLNLQHFMDDMQIIGNQVRSNNIKKPNFHYGDLTVTNYLLWLLLAEIMMLNDKNSKGEE
jgi:hypothetical protein